MSADNIGADGGCKECAAMRSRTPETKATNARYNAKEEVKERKREHSLLPQSKARKAVYRESPEGKAARVRGNVKARQRVTGWTEEMFIEALVEQNNACAICKKPFTNDTKKNTPHTDHCHSCPPIPRSLLCNNCNIAIGMLRDSPEICEEAAAYLRRWETQCR